MLLLLTFLDFKYIFPSYVYYFYISKDLKNICYEGTNSAINVKEEEEEEDEEEDQGTKK